MDNWRNFVGKEFKGTRSGRYKVIECTEYSGRMSEWKGHDALYIQSLSSKGKQKFPLILSVLSRMKKHFKPSRNMDEAFEKFCKKINIPKLPSQHTIESYYISFFNCFLRDPLEPSIILNDDSQGLESGEEGKSSIVYTTKYERDPKLRKQAIKLHGLSCKGCGFTFENFYGVYGKGYIHIHHIEPLFEYGGSRKVNPEKDLIPLCANCHAIVHRRKNKTLSIDELKNIIKSSF